MSVKVNITFLSIARCIAIVNMSGWALMVINDPCGSRWLIVLTGVRVLIIN